MSHAPQDPVARFWRSLEERSAGSREPSEVTAQLDEAPIKWRAAPPDVPRRRFLQLLGTTVAIPSLAACTRQPPEKIIPYVKPPEEIVPGRPLFYASASVLGGVGLGTLVETHMGRPTKVEGNPDHPGSLGSTDIFAQAEILQLYDPDRSQTVLHNGVISSFGEAAGAIQAAMLRQRSKDGVGLRILTGDTSSPTFIHQMRELMDEMPHARWHIHEPAGRANAYRASLELFGEALETRWDLSRAEVILSLDADFLGAAEGHPRLVRDFAARRSLKEGVNRLFVVESELSVTGANADHRAAVKASQVEHVARVIASKLVAGDGSLRGDAKLPALVHEATVDKIVADLRRAGEKAAILAGRYQPPVVHMLAAVMNDALGSRAVSYSNPILASGTEPVASLADLVTALDSGQVELLVIIGCNPVYATPGDLDVRSSLVKAKVRVHHGTHIDETAALCDWHIPAAHPLEAWSDVCGQDGTVSVIQPMIEPLYGGKSAHEMIGALSRQPDRTGYDIVRDKWRAESVGSFEQSWSSTVHDGLLPFSERSAKTPALTQIAWPPASKVGDALELVVRPDPCIYDGTYSNNAWLQELPKPLTKLTWDNAAMIAPATAVSRDLETGDVVKLSVGDRSVLAAVFVLPGTAPDVIVAHLGYGRERVGDVALGCGFDAYRLTHAGGPLHSPVTLEKTGDSYPLSTAQTHHSMEGRDLVRSTTAAKYAENPLLWKEKEHPRISLYPKHPYPGYSWGMTIDLTTCIGCNACVVACQAENNIPVVGKEEVAKGREMHWIRIDRYFEGDADMPATHFQPVPCMHCELAPCEVVCPVQATVHHDEGLNDMVYNRCVGTKYCSNNCPYKVRRFNFFGYGVHKVAPMDPSHPSVALSHNPDVTVRGYGVMEKCSYCVQRINYARVAAKKEDRNIRDGEVMTACQAVCPARAITFGNINDEKSEVARKKAEPRNYALLAELNTEPRTTYLAKLGNPHPDLSSAPPDEGHH